jgi:hypothetical protein
MVRAALIALLLTACAAPQVVYKPVPLSMPDRPTLPTIQGEALQCLSDAAYTAIVERDRARKLYAEQLEAVIESTH